VRSGRFRHGCCVINFVDFLINGKCSYNGRNKKNFAVFAKKTLRPLQLNLSTIAYKVKSAFKMRIFAKTLLHENRLSES
jgi:hypothetical protein